MSDTKNTGRETKIKLTLFLLTLVVLTSCKEKRGSETDLKQEYFPTTRGLWIEYDVTDIRHDVQSDTSIYQLREIIAGDFIDDEGRLAQRIERFWRPDSTQQWEIKDVWTAVRQANRAEKTEEDVRFIKLGFPVDFFKTWNGNAFNTGKEWEYYYKKVDDTLTVGGIFFDTIAEVNQRNNINFAEYEIASEIYAKHIGLVYKRLIDLDVNNGNPADIIKGIEYTQVVTDYGQD